MRSSQIQIQIQRQKQLPSIDHDPFRCSQALSAHVTRLNALTITSSGFRGSGLVREALVAHLASWRQLRLRFLIDLSDGGSSDAASPR